MSWVIPCFPVLRSFGNDTLVESVELLGPSSAILSAQATEGNNATLYCDTWKVIWYVDSWDWYILHFAEELMTLPYEILPGKKRNISEVQ